jgi:hypothetical protein
VAALSIDRSHAATIYRAHQQCAVDIPALAAAINRPQHDVEKMIDCYERDSVPAGWEPPRRAGEPQRPLFVRTHLHNTTDLSAAASSIGALLDREPLQCGNIGSITPPP